MKRIISIFSVLFFLFIMSCGSSTTATPDTGEAVTIQSLSFSPSTLTIAVGTTVTWTNNGGTNHTVTSGTFGDADSGTEFDSRVVIDGETFVHEFTTAGTYDYHCDLHPTMTGTITVE